jgi:hypothetical protein
MNVDVHGAERTGRVLLGPYIQFHECVYINLSVWANFSWLFSSSHER